MTDGFALIKIDGKIMEPATVLITKISDALGGLYKPYQIRRVSKAEADAAIIKEQVHIEINDIQRRAFNRFVTEEAKKQDNIESITEKAIPQLTASSTPQDMDNDWIMNFFDKCRIVSDDEMQLLWAKVLAGEANSPGTYSKRTVNSLGSLDKKDAELFTKLCSFSWFIDDRYCPLIYDTHASIYNDQEIRFSSLTHLDDIGLISYSVISDIELVKLDQQITVSYFNTSRILKFRNTENNELGVGCVMLTTIGQELTNICSSEPIDGFYDYVIERWTKEGIGISSPNSS